MSNAYRTLVSLTVALLAFAGLNALLIYIDSTFITYILANFTVCIDKILGSWLVLPPFLSWTLMGLIAGTFVYLSVFEGERFNSRGVRIALIAFPVAVLVLSPVVWARVELDYIGPMTFTGEQDRKPGEELQLGTYSFVWVPPGRFRMGSVETESGRKPDETPHLVTMSRGFWLGKYEITQRQWQDVMGNNPARFAGCDDCPVENVSSADCRQFIEKLTGFTQQYYRLPTEAEWEYAARAGAETAWPSGDEPAGLETHAWYAANSGGETHPAGSKEPNAWGLFDMHGNVREWCADMYAPYAETRQIDPVGPAEGELYVARGGGWNSTAEDCRFARRTTWQDGYFQPKDDIGFRLVYMETPPPGAEPVAEPESEEDAELDEEGRREHRQSLVERILERNKAVDEASDGEVPVPERSSAGEISRRALPLR